MLNVLIQIESIEVHLSFFINQKACQCTLSQSFKAVIQMMCVIKNNKSVQMTVLNDQEDYAIFQPYTPRDRDQYDYKTVWHDSRKKED